MSQTRGQRPTAAARALHVMRTPKGILLLVLFVIVVIAGRVEGSLPVSTLVVVSVAFAALPDAFYLRWRDGRWHWPLGAIITGLLVASVLSPREPWYAAAAASALGILGKRLIRTRWTNVVNPAAFGLVAVYHLFDSALSWWGAMPGIVPGAAWPLLASAGGYIVHRVRRWPLVIAFFASYFALFSAATFMLNPQDVAEVFVAPDLQAAVFFAVFMLTDPPTSPAPERAQAVAGLLVGASCVVIFLAAGTAEFLLSGLLVGNVWESLRRIVVRRFSLRRRLPG